MPVHGSCILHLNMRPQPKNRKTCVARRRFGKIQQLSGDATALRIRIYSKVEDHDRIWRYTKYDHTQNSPALFDYKGTMRVDIFLNPAGDVR